MKHYTQVSKEKTARAANVNLGKSVLWFGVKGRYGNHFGPCLATGVGSSFLARMVYNHESGPSAARENIGAEVKRRFLRGLAETMYKCKEKE